MLSKRRWTVSHYLMDLFITTFSFPKIWQAKGQTPSWAAPNPARPDRQQRWFSHCAQPWSPVCRAGPHHLGRMWRSWNCPKEGNKASERAGCDVLWGAAEGSGLIWFGEEEAEGWPCGSLKGMGGTSLWCSVIGHVGMIQNCINRGSVLILESICLLRCGQTLEQTF